MHKLAHIASLLLVLSGIFSACNTPDLPQGDEQAESEILQNLPISDRDLLLEPLERALDDLCDVIRLDESTFASSAEVTENGQKAVMSYKIDGKDTIYLRAELSSAYGSERHEWFAYEDGQVFFAHHTFDNPSFGATEAASHREYKFYYEDNGAQLSAYARVALDGGSVPDIWTPVCLTREEERALAARQRLIHRYLSNQLPQ